MNYVNIVVNTTETVAGRENMKTFVHCMKNESIRMKSKVNERKEPAQ